MLKTRVITALVLVAVFAAAWLLRKRIGASSAVIGTGFLLMLFIFAAFMYNIFW